MAVRRELAGVEDLQCPGPAVSSPPSVNHGFFVRISLSRGGDLPKHLNPRSGAPGSCSGDSPDPFPAP